MYTNLNWCHLIQCEHAVIYEALKYAYKIGLVPGNAATKVDRPKKIKIEPQFLDADELEVMFKALKGTPFELPVLVASFYSAYFLALRTFLISRSLPLNNTLQ